LGRSLSRRTREIDLSISKVSPVPKKLSDMKKVQGLITSNLASTKYVPGQLYFSSVSTNPGFDYFYIMETSASTRFSPIF